MFCVSAALVRREKRAFEVDSQGTSAIDRVVQQFCETAEGAEQCLERGGNSGGEVGTHPPPGEKRADLMKRCAGGFHNIMPAAAVDVYVEQGRNQSAVGPLDMVTAGQRDVTLRGHLSNDAVFNDDYRTLDYLIRSEKLGGCQYSSHKTGYSRAASLCPGSVTDSQAAASSEEPAKDWARPLPEAFWYGGRCGLVRGQSDGWSGRFGICRQE